VGAVTPAAIEYLLPHVPNGAPSAEGPDAFFLCEVAWQGETKEFTFCYRCRGDIALFGVEGDYSVPTLDDWEMQQGTEILRHAPFPDVAHLLSWHSTMRLTLLTFVGAAKLGLEMRHRAPGGPSWTQVPEAICKAVVEEGTFALGPDSDNVLLEKQGELLAEQKSMQDEIDRLRALLDEIHDFAHAGSNGPEVPDPLWDVVTMAQRGL
jgi:hypothetical protein